MKLSTYLTYDGNAREAFTFYQQVLGGTLELMTFAQAPDAEQFLRRQYRAGWKLS